MRNIPQMIFCGCRLLGIVAWGPITGRPDMLTAMLVDVPTTTGGTLSLAWGDLSILEPSPTRSARDCYPCLGNEP